MEQDFELKHRLLGAAVLIVFGVLVLPWWLSPPESEVGSDAEVGSATIEAVSGKGTTSAEELDPDLLATLLAQQAQNTDGEEQVLVSRITPLDEDDLVADSETDANDSSRADSKNESPASTETAQKTAVADTNAASGSTSTKQPELTSSNAPAQQQSGAVNDTEKDDAIEVGWAVQVGVFTDKTGADKVVDDLKAKGFNPKTTVVDTNKGPKTGTRVWLGPYEARVDAAKAKTSLTEKTGEPGFIRSYP